MFHLRNIEMRGKEEKKLCSSFLKYLMSKQQKISLDVLL